ncbi:divalent cation tolerance protein CutA, partial [Enterococcus faecium]|uniref:divalent-cation tolerance protein CutA n=1 Tax=Enterococcus faecium TaxID=1352 RepID=UPI003F42DAE0
MTPASVPLVMLYSPFPTLAEAQQAARQLLAEKLIACANILPAGISMYVWENMLHESPETVLLAKTTPSMADRAVERLL